MADIKDLKFQEAGFKGKDVASLSDTPSSDGVSARELKKRFDNVGKYMVALGKHNELIDALSSCDQDGSGAQNIGVYREVGGVQEPSNVQQRLDELAYDVANFSIEGGDTLMVKSEYAGDSYGVVRNAEKLDGLSLQQLMLKMYPVGSVYMSVSNANPASLFGGTWEAWGAGRVPVGINTVDTDFSTSEKTGGYKTHTLGVAEMPSHTHTATVGNQSASHTHTITTGNQSNNHTHTGPSHTHTSASHSHIENAAVWANQIPSSGAASGVMYVSRSASGGNWLTQAADTGDPYKRENINTSSTTPGATGTSGTGNTGANSVSHTHSGTTAAQSASHSHAVTNAAAGGGSAHNNLQPYITCYMWKRTA